MPSTLTINSAIITAAFDEVASPGAISVPGLKVGDTMIALSAPALGPGSLIGLGWYEAIVSVDDEIQQLTSTTTPGSTFTAIFVRT